MAVQRQLSDWVAANLFFGEDASHGTIRVGVAMKLKDVRRPVPVPERIGVDFPRYFTARLEAGKTPYDEVQWELRTASIGNDKGAVIFEQRDVEVPVDWSQTATNIVVSKYFYGKIGSPERETSVRQLVGRVVDTIADWGARTALLHARPRTPKISATSWRT